MQTETLLDPNQKSKESNEENDTETANTKGPDSTQLARRGALVPPKIDDPMEATDDNADELSQDDLEVACNGDGLIGGQGSPRSYPPRRSSVVVIPPMQVCPGDLLVYSKALTHRGNFPGIFWYIHPSIFTNLACYESVYLRRIFCKGCVGFQIFKFSNIFDISAIFSNYRKKRGTSVLETLKIGVFCGFFIACRK